MIAMEETMGKCSACTSSASPVQQAAGRGPFHLADVWVNADLSFPSGYIVQSPPGEQLTENN